MNIPFLDLHKVNLPYEAETLAATKRVVQSGWYLRGTETKQFEQELAALCDTAYAVGVSNGLDALRLIFRAYIELGRLRPGDGVIVQANTYIASVLPLTELGLRPILVDINPLTLNLDWGRAEMAVDADNGIKAILAVHLYGAVCWHYEITPRLIKRGLLIVEDNAQAIGAVARKPSPITGSHRSGALGHAAAFSFYPTKNVGAMGDGGAVTSSDKELIHTVSALANYGADRRYHNIYTGWNCRLDELQAAILRIRLRDLSRITAARREKAMLYNSLLRNQRVKKPDWQQGSVWHQYVIRVSAAQRSEFCKILLHNGIETDVHYAVPPHRQPCYVDYRFGIFPAADSLANECVSLPIASASLSDIAAIAHCINKNI